MSADCPPGPPHLYVSFVGHANRYRGSDSCFSNGTVVVSQYDPAPVYAVQGSGESCVMGFSLKAHYETLTKEAWGVLLRRDLRRFIVRTDNISQNTEELRFGSLGPVEAWKGPPRSYLRMKRPWRLIYHPSCLRLSPTSRPGWPTTRILQVACHARGMSDPSPTIMYRG